jgi:hypothetical protein
MEEKGRYNESRNKPDLVSNFLKSKLVELSDRRMVLFVPVKCETYLREEATTRALYEELGKAYSGLHSHFAVHTLAQHVVSVTTPVQTTGNLIFSRIEPDGTFKFRKISRQAPFNPKDADQPLRYMLRFMVKYHYDTRVQGLFTWLRRMFGGDEYLLKAINDFSSGCKKDMPFKIHQGEQFL